MSFQKNRAFLKRKLSNAFALGMTLLTLTGSAASLSAAYDACCPDPCETNCFDLCDCCMPDFVVWADFIYWQVHPEGLQFARTDGISPDTATPLETKGRIISPDCKIEAGFRVGAMIDIGCCNWDVFAQYTWLRPCLSKRIDNDFVPGSGEGSGDLHPLIWNLAAGLAGDQVISEAKATWDNSYNVLDFGMGRTFSANCCFDFRPHLGFKATWQQMKYNVSYVHQTSTTDSENVQIKSKTDFNGIGLRGGFNAAWRFTPCVSLVGGVSVAAVWSDIEVNRKDFYESEKVVDIEDCHCALIPATELLLGIRFDTTVCSCYNIFVFAGWENQIWWNLNRFLFVSNSTGESNSYQFGPHGNVTYQGLTVRGGLMF